MISACDVSANNRGISMELAEIFELHEIFDLVRFDYNIEPELLA